MKKQLILAALSAALLAAPYAQAGSGFSRSASSSSSSSSASKSAAPSPKPSAPAYKPAEPKRDYGSYSSYGSGSSKKTDTPKPETPAYSYNPAPSPAKSGFGAEPKSNTGKKVAGVAAATALGGALYAANASSSRLRGQAEGRRSAGCHGFEHLACHDGSPFGHPHDHGAGPGSADPKLLVADPVVPAATAGCRGAGSAAVSPRLV